MKYTNVTRTTSIPIFELEQQRRRKSLEEIRGSPFHGSLHFSLLVINDKWQME